MPRKRRKRRTKRRGDKRMSLKCKARSKDILEIVKACTEMTTQFCRDLGLIAPPKRG